MIRLIKTQEIESYAKYKLWVNVVRSIQADFNVAFERDPAARSWLEVLTCYPGLHVLATYRVAHILYYNYRLFWLARFIAHIARWVTGIEIHPGAMLGQKIFIDHGMGVVIGETAIVGDGALMYQGVTLGGTGKQKGGKRHPTLGNNVVVGAGAKVLGDIEIGNNTRIGAGSVVLRSVPSDCTVVGIPGQVICRAGKRMDLLAHSQTPDPVANVIDALTQKINGLEARLQQLYSDQARVIQLSPNLSNPSFELETKVSKAPQNASRT